MQWPILIAFLGERKAQLAVQFVISQNSNNKKISIIEKRRNLTATLILTHSYVISWNNIKHTHIDYFSHEFSKSTSALSLLSHSNTLKEIFEIYDFSIKS